MVNRSQVALALAQFVVAIAVTIALAFWRGLGVQTLLTANLAACGLLLAVTAGAAASGYLQWNHRLRRFWPALGILLAPAAFTGWAVEQAEPLRAWPDLVAVLRYALPFTVLLVLQSTVAIPRLSPPASEHPASGRSGALFFTYLVLSLVVACISISLLSRFAVLPLHDVVSPEIVAVIPIFALAYAFNAVHFALVPALHRSERPLLPSQLACGAAVLNVVLSLVLVPELGMLGAALATLATFLALAGVTVWAAQRAFPIPYEHARLTKIACAGAIVYLGALRWPPSEDWTLIAGYLAAALLSFPVVLSLSGFLRRHERDALRRFASLSNG